MTTGQNATFVQLPSKMNAYEFVINGLEAFFWLISLFANGIFLVVLKRTPTVHRNLKLLTANMIVVYMITAITRFLQLYDYATKNISEDTMYWIQLVRRIAMTAKTASEVTLLIERVISTVFAERYEENKSVWMTIGLLSLCYVYPAVSMPLSSYEVIGRAVFVPLPIIFNVLSWTFAGILFKINKNTFVSDLNISAQDFGLSKRYQTAENIRTLRMIFWFLMYSTISNAITVSIYIYYVFHIDIQKDSDFYSFFDAFWFFLNAVSCSLLSVPFIVKHNVMRARFIKRYQTVENIRTLRMIFWFLMYSTISNAITVSLYGWFVFYIDANNQSDLYAFYDAFWFCLNAFSASLLSIPFITKHEAMRRRYMNLICRNSSKITSEKQIRSVTGKALLNENDLLTHFKDLQRVWEGS
ncbi:hypothetical protein FO519_001346 [Halicephalobus sp. NKZ332]|nr:hypothetical protein FO519_001346 [Halicephalobus sp. NKZ332]